MADEFVKLPDNDAFTPQGVPASVGAGADAWAKAFEKGGADVAAIYKAHKSAEEKLAKIKSDAAVYTAQTTADQIATQAKMDIAYSPKDAAIIASKASETIQHIAEVTPTDKPEKLKYILGNTASSVLVKGSSTQASQNLRDLKVDFVTKLPSALNSVKEALGRKDIPAYIDARDNLNATTVGLFSSGALSASDYNGVHKILSHYDEGLEKLPSAKHGEEQGHIIADNSLFGEGAHHELSRTEKASTSANKLHNTATFDQLTASLASGGTLDLLSFLELKGDKQDALLEYSKGVSQVNGKLNAGTDFQQLNERHDYLKSLRNPTPIEQGEEQRLDNVLNSLNSGEFNKIIKSLPAGQRLLQQRDSEAQAPSGATQAEVDMLAYKARDNYLTNAANLWRSQNGDPSFIRAGDTSVLKITSAMTNPEVASSEALKDILSYSPSNRVYLANSFKDPLHQATVLMSSNLAGRVPNHDIIDLLDSVKNFKSNKLSYANLNKDQRAGFKSKVAGFLGANKDELDYLQTIGATTLRNNVANLQGQYMLHKTIQNHGKVSGGDEFNNLLKKSLNVVAGDGYIFSLNALPGVNATQADVIGRTVLKEAYNTIGRKYLNAPSILSSVFSKDSTNSPGLVGNLAARVSNIFTRSDVPIKVYNELNGDIKAIDSAGQVIVSHHFTRDYIDSVLSGK